MKTPLLALGASCFLFGVLSAQTPETLPLPVPVPPTSPPEQTTTMTTAALAAYCPPPVVVKTETGDEPPRFWGSKEFLFWWVKHGPTPPLVTSGDPGNAAPGALGQAGTQVLFGNSGLNYGPLLGGRIVFGGWFDSSRQIGLEANGFLIDEGSDDFSRSSNAAGTPLLAIPARLAPAGQEGAIVAANPGLFSGGIAINSTSHLWGLEANGLWNLDRAGNYEWNLLAGLRYLNLGEHLDIQFASNALTADDKVRAQDLITTRSQFLGPQLGSRVQWQTGRWGIFFTGKLAIGSTRQTVSRNGSSSESGVDAQAPGSHPGGIFTQPSNLGQLGSEQFSIVPSCQLKFSYDVTKRIRVIAGYDFLYWSSVARPGDQIDRTLNLQQSPVFMNPQLPAGGPTRPAAIFGHSDFWTQGINIGWEARW